MNSHPKYADIQAGGLRDNASDYNDPDGYENGNGRHAGGSAGARGNVSTAGTKNKLGFIQSQGFYDPITRLLRSNHKAFTIQLLSY